MKVTDAARLLGAGAKELIEKIAGTREGTQDALAELRKLEEQGIEVIRMSGLIG